jgi:hypothetical protein
MRNLVRMQPDQPSFPLLESADLPGTEDWTVVESLHFNDALETDDDQLESLTVAPSFDE